MNMNKETNLIFKQIENNIEQDSIRNYNYKVIKECLESIYKAENSQLKNRTFTKSVLKILKKYLIESRIK